MKKRLLSVVLVLCMILTLLPTAAATDVSSADELAAALGGTAYATVSGDTVTMNANVTLAETITIASGTVVLDLNGRTITGASGVNTDGHETYGDSSGKTAVAVTGGTLTIMDSGTDGTLIGGNVYTKSSAWKNGAGGGHGVYVNGGAVTISGGTLQGGVGGLGTSSGGSGGSGISVQSGMVSVAGGTFTGGAGGGGSTGGAQGSAVVINGGSVSGNLSGTPTNGSGTEVQLYTLTVNRADGSALADTAVTALTATDKLGYTYGMTGVKTDADGKLYVYLPAGKTAVSVTAGGVTFSGSVTGGTPNTATLTPVHTHCVCGGSVTTGNHTSHSDLTFTGVNNTDKFPGEVWNGNQNGLWKITEGSYYLTEDVTLTKPLVVAEGTTVNLCLNGHKLSASNGVFNIFQVNGTLNLCDCAGNGTLTGVTTTDGGDPVINMSSDGVLNLYGGSIADNRALGVYNSNGTFTMYGGSIERNTGAGVGGLVNAGVFTMCGGSITANSGSMTGGVAYQDGSVTLSGNVNISGNTVGGASSNVVLMPYSGHNPTICITQALTNSTAIGVSIVEQSRDNAFIPKAGVFTSGDTVTNSTYLSKFVSDNSSFAVIADSGQLKLAAAQAIIKTSVTNGSFTVKVNGNEVPSAVQGDTVTVTPTAASGYTLDKITVAKTGDANTAVTVANGAFTMPNYPVTVTVSFNAASTPGTSSGGGTAPAVTVPVSSDAGKVSVSASVTNGTASVSVTDSQLKAIVSDSADTGTVKVDVSGLKNVTAASVSAKLVDAAAKASGVTGLTVSVPGGSVALDRTALGAVNTGNTVVVSVDPVAHEKLSDTQKAGVPSDALIVDVNVLVNGAKMHDFNGGKITVSIPYTLKSGENPDSVTVWYLEDNGSLTPMNGKYDPASGMVVFTTTHLSQYVIGSFPFTDVPDNTYYYAAVVWAAGNGVTDGTSSATFAPDSVCTRAQAVTFLWRAMGSPEPTAEACPFTDVSTEAYYYKAVLWAAEKSIIEGASAAAFSPNGAVTRAEAATLLWRAAGKPAAAAPDPFADVASGAYYEKAVLWAAAQKIVGGTGGTAFSPEAPGTRAQIVTFLWRWLGQ